MTKAGDELNARTPRLMTLAATPGPPRHSPRSCASRAATALLVGAIWFITALPIVLGVTSCPVARFLHTPCPGCGMTRAMDLLLHGELGASLAMHPLAIPTALSQLAFAIVTVFLSFRHGTPFLLWKTRVGRVAVHAVAIVMLLDLLLWIARFLGLANGPVPV